MLTNPFPATGPSPSRRVGGRSNPVQPTWHRPMWRRGAELALAAWLLAMAAIPIRAHRNPEAPFPSIKALRVDAPLVIDGLLNEAIWAQAPVATNFFDTRTHRSADLQTTLRVAYSDTHLYLAVECFDDRIDQLHASERREDRPFAGDDWVQVNIDPGHSHRAKYSFLSNPLGTRADGNEGPVPGLNYGWTAEWDLAAKIFLDRWTFEMGIPFSVMNYRRKDGQTWGINLNRQQRNTDVLSFWSYNVTDFYRVRYFGHLTGLDLAKTNFKRSWEVTPYASIQADFNRDNKTLVRAGVDASVRLTPSVSSSFTLHPDFGQVEADDDTIELRDTERFLPEKRLFFREGDEMMRMTHRLYYSRRFTDITAAAQASGRGDGFSFNALSLQGNLAHPDGHRGNSTVVRLLQEIGETSAIGYYAASSELERGHSRVLGIEANFLLTDAWKFSLQTAAADERLRNAAGRLTKDRTDYLGQVAVNYDLYPWRFGAGYQAISPEFNPILGFIPRRNEFGPFLSGEYGVSGRRTWYKRIVLNPRFNYYQTERGQTSLRDYRFDATVRLANDLGLHAGQDVDYHAPHRNTRSKADVTFLASDFWRSATVGWAGGQFERVDYQEVFLAKPLKLFERWMLRPEFSLRLEDRPAGRRETIWLNRLVLDFSLTDRMWIKSSLQHRNAGVHNISFIYGWRIRPRTNWYVVFNSVRNVGRAAGDSVFTKMTYTL